ncbi:MAG TPA: alpha/beta fold hydrolase [Frankiaceae bacterium]|nr:alpha/beta fold hydrolase [Frankiaceae bacterium]
MPVVDMPASETGVTLSVRIDRGGDDERPPLGESGRTAVLAHGAGSSGEFVQRAFGPPLRAAGWCLVSYDLRGHGRSSPVRDPARLGLDRHVQDLLTVADRVGATMLGGVSMGAHAAVLAALDQRAPPNLVGLLLALPAWTGEPEAVAAANAVQAAELRAVGTSAVLTRVCRDHPGWVADELAMSWPAHDQTAFASVLDALAMSSAPTDADLGQLPMPVGLVALDDDPMHPAAVAERWSRAIPRAELEHVGFDLPAGDRAVLGRAALAAWDRARSLSGTG